MTNELWKPIPDWPYEVSNTGKLPATVSGHLHGRAKSVKGYTFEWRDRLTAIIKEEHDA